MQLKKQYESIADTMFYLMLQIRDSIDYADKIYIPAQINGDKVEYLWNRLKNDTVYIDDGAGEVIQSMPTLFEKNIWNIRGAGDCDCMTVTASACFLVLNIPARIILAGRDKYTPVHIYNEIKTVNGYLPFDLTADKLGNVRTYPFKQVIPLR